SRGGGGLRWVKRRPVGKRICFRSEWRPPRGQVRRDTRDRRGRLGKIEFEQVSHRDFLADHVPHLILLADLKRERAANIAQRRGPLDPGATPRPPPCSLILGIHAGRGREDHGNPPWARDGYLGALAETPGLVAKVVRRVRHEPRPLDLAREPV